MSRKKFTSRLVILAFVILLLGCAGGTETHKSPTTSTSPVVSGWSIAVARLRYVEIVQSTTCASQLFIQKLNWATNMDNETLIAGREKALIAQSLKLVRVERSLVFHLRQGIWPSSMHDNINQEINAHEASIDKLLSIQTAHNRTELLDLVYAWLFGEDPSWEATNANLELLKLSSDEAFSCPSMPGLIESNMKAREALGEFAYEDEAKAEEYLRDLGGDVYKK